MEEQAAAEPFERVWTVAAQLRMHQELYMDIYQSLAQDYISVQASSRACNHPQQQTLEGVPDKPSEACDARPALTGH